MAEAADALGTSKDAIRMRVRRGTLRSEKGEDGRVYVFVEPDQYTVPPVSQDEGSTSPLVDALKDEIAHLRRESERKDAIIMSLSQSNAELSRTIRAIEPPSPSTARTPQEHPDDEEPWREGHGMSPRDPDTHQPWHFQRYGAPPAESPADSEASRMPQEQPEERGPTNTPTEAHGAERPPEHRSWWLRGRQSTAPGGGSSSSVSE
jgi:hypothetical protein